MNKNAILKITSKKLTLRNFHLEANSLICNFANPWIHHYDISQQKNELTYVSERRFY
ncbi:MAG: hypothetical protein H6Q14_2416 [Bacteroidetes bacterium]|jgi:hypothetical protein|nr:hypothetical protein [Bacteroidota bacterium]